jgi:hypothetical protein
MKERTPIQKLINSQGTFSLLRNNTLKSEFVNGILLEYNFKTKQFQVKVKDKIQNFAFE